VLGEICIEQQNQRPADRSIAFRTGEGAGGSAPRSCLESRRLAWLEAVAMGSAAAAARVFAASRGVIRYPCEAGLMAAAGRLAYL
jgi:hypothetical protein